jgi:hypothetical protein
MEFNMCQGCELNRIGKEASVFEKGLHFVKRTMGFFRNRLYLLNSILNGRILKKNKPDTKPALETFHPGEPVRVKSKEEISGTLDEWQHCEGCRFMYEMWKYCGGTFKVYKKVNNFLDERTMKMMKSDHIYLLEGLICEGSWPFTQCDRSCFYFWRAEWLERAK